jgi:hypothetical protein
MSTGNELNADVLAISKARPPTMTRRKSGMQRRSEQVAVDVERRGRRPETAERRVKSPER